MGPQVEPAVLGRLSEFVCRITGLNFNPDRWNDLDRGIRSAAGEFGFDDASAFAEWLITSSLNQEQVALLASHLTIGETYFFRESRAFDALREQILPALIEERRNTSRRLRLWSAGCCTGEEPYSIAIMLRRMLPDIEQWNVSILATDINPIFLKRAQAGSFSEWSFRGVPPEVREKYFTHTPTGRYEIGDLFKKLITFNYLNLAEDVYPSLLNNTNAMDVVFCRNVMIYLSEAQSSAIVQRLGRSLVDGGCLIVGATEASLLRSSELTSQTRGGVTICCKAPGKTEGYHTAINLAPEPAWTPPTSVEIPVPMPIAAPVAAPVHIAAPTPARPTLDEATELYRRGRYSQAAEILELLAADVNAEVSVLVLLARAQANQGKLDEARRWCHRAIEMDRLNPSWHYLRGTIFQESGQWAEAQMDYGHALYLDPDFVMAHVALSHVARRQGNFKQAQRHRDNALSLLNHSEADQTLPESEGLTAARLAQILSAATTLEEAKA